MSESNPPDPAPLVSVLIPTYYRNEGLREAIESAQAQTYSNIEIIVVDDSGASHAEPVCDRFDVVYVDKDENEGPMAAWNEGFRHLNGDYVQILDDDDVLFPEKIEKQVAILERDDSVGVVHCGMRWDFGVDNFPDAELSGVVLPKVLTLDTSPCVTSTMLIDRELLEEIRPIDEYEGAADDVLKIELARRTEFDFVNEILVLRGTGDDNVSASMGPIRASKRILEEYSDLYEQVDPSVRREALSKILYREGYAYLSEDVWSWKAIACFARSVYLCPTRGFRPLLVFILSFGGRPAVTALERVGAQVRRTLQKVFQT